MVDVAPASTIAGSTPPRLLQLRWLAAPFLALLAVPTALSFGSYPISVWEVLRFFFALSGLTFIEPERYALLYNLIIEIRLPRVLAAVLVGAGLSTSGAAYQALFRNPLVSPGLLGVLAGAAAGAAIGILLNGNWLRVQAGAFLMGLAAVGVAVGIAHIFGGGSIIMLILGGILSGALFASLVTIVKYLADPYSQLPTLVYWLMGNLGQAHIQEISWAAIPLLSGIVLLCLMGRPLDALAMGEDEARALGVPVKTIRFATIVAATLISALTVSIAGMIGWIGLIVPHVARLLTGPCNARLLPAAACLGAAFLLVSDGLARNVFTSELPIGIVTELLGIPVFLLVLHRARRSWT